MLLVDVAMLLTVVAICILGLVHYSFKDNQFQCFGMIGLVFWCIAELFAINRGWEPPAYDSFLYASLMLYGLGTWAKARKFQKRDKREKRDGRPPSNGFTKSTSAR
jgi:hypothetical protein